MAVIEVVVAIVSYQCADLTIECLRSIEVERSTPGLRIRAIVVDNASGDAPEIADAISSNAWSSWVTLISSPRNGGFGYGNNVAFRCAFDRGPPDYLHVLNPDTRLLKGAIGALVDFFETHPDAGIAGSSFENQDGSEWRIAFRFPSILGELEGGLQFRLATRLLRRWAVARQMGRVPEATDWVGGASVMIRRKVVETIGGFDERFFLYYEETDLCRRAKMAGFQTWYVPDSHVMHIGGQSTKAMERNARPARLPACWFESRRHYFAANHGIAYAMALDMAALTAHGLGRLKRLVQRRSDGGTPHYLWDLARHSVLWPGNRKLARTGRQVGKYPGTCGPEGSRDRTCLHSESRTSA